VERGIQNVTVVAPICSEYDQNAFVILRRSSERMLNFYTRISHGINALIHGQRLGQGCSIGSFNRDNSPLPLLVLPELGLREIDVSLGAANFRLKFNLLDAGLRRLKLDAVNPQALNSQPAPKSQIGIRAEASAGSVNLSRRRR